MARKKEMCSSENHEPGAGIVLMKLEELHSFEGHPFKVERNGVKESVPMAIAKNLMEMLVPFVKESVGEINLPDRILTMEKTDGEIAEDNLDWEKEADMDAALDFADSF